MLVLRHKFAVGQQHLLVVPKATCYDLRKLRRRQLIMVAKLRELGMFSHHFYTCLPGLVKDLVFLCVCVF